MKKLIGLLAISLLFLFPQAGWTIGGTEGIGAPLPPNRIGGDNFIRYIGDRLILDFHEGAGTTVRDLSGNGNNGTFGSGAAAPTWERNRLSFDGGDYVSVPYASSLDFKGAGVSLSLLVKASLTTVAANRGLLGRWDRSSERQYCLYFTTTNDKMTFYLDDGATQHADGANNSWLVNTEYFVSGIANAGTMTLYMNSVSSSITDTYGTIEDIGTEEALDIGMIDRGLTPAYWQGLISFIRINSKAFSALEVQREYLWNLWRN